MADNVTPEAVVTPAAFSFAADDIGGVQFPRTKLALGADGVNDGDVSAANPLPVAPIAGQLGVAAGAGAVNALTQRVTHASDDPAVAGIGGVSDVAGISGGTGSLSAKLRLMTSQLDAISGYLDGVEAALAARATEVTLAAAAASLAVIDDWDEADRAKINPIVGQAGVAAGAGAVAATVQRMTLASDDPAVAGIGATTDVAAAAGGAGSLSAKLRLITSQLATQAGYLDGVETALAGLALESGGNLTAAAASLVSAVTALQIIDDWDETDRCKTNTRLEAHTAGGASMHKTVSAASTNATVVKAAAGQIYGIQVSSVNAVARYLKLYDKATAPTVGTDVPVKTLVIPGNTAGAGFVIAWPAGLVFANGIAFALTTEATDAGATAVAASEHVVNIDFK